LIPFVCVDCVDVCVDVCVDCVVGLMFVDDAGFVLFCVSLCLITKSKEKLEPQSWMTKSTHPLVVVLSLLVFAAISLFALSPGLHAREHTQSKAQD